MLRNYLKVAIRNIRKNKLYASLNILGLAVGLASFFIIYLFLRNELAYDNFHSNSERIYRVIEEIERDSGVEKNGGLTSALAPKAAENLPQIQAFSRVSMLPKSISTQQNQDSLLYVKTLSVDPGFLKFFDLTFSAGMKENALKEPKSTLINESRAEQLFGTTDVLGHTLLIDGLPLKITGVFQDLPLANSLKAEIIVPIKEINPQRKDSFTQWNVSYGDQTYFLLQEGADVVTLEGELNKLYASNINVQGRTLRLQAISDIHFSLDVSDGIQEKSDSQYIIIFTLIASFILASSVFNYTSLALSQSIERSKEIGMRQVVGAKKKQLYGQFIVESFFHVLVAFTVSLFLVLATVPYLENLIERPLNFDIGAYPTLLCQGLVLSAGVAVLSATYPAFFITNFNVVNVLKKSNAALTPQNLLNVITVFQLIVFVVLISAAFTANRQLRFLQNENLGFDNEQQQLIMLFSPQATRNVKLLKNNLSEISGVSSVTYAKSIPTRALAANTFKGYDFQFYNFHVDEDYLETMGMELVSGRGFKAEDSQTKDLVIVNETAVRKLGFEQQAVGKIIRQGSRELRIIGVVSDFHFASKKVPIEATLFRPIKRGFGYMVLKLQGNNIQSATLTRIKNVYSDVTGGLLLDYTHLDEEVDIQYKQEGIMISMINVFTLMAALVALIGLFGISGYTMKRKIREICIRKILGADFFSIQKTLNINGLLKLISAVLISLPIVVFWMNNWLQSFAYQIDFPVTLVMLAFLLASVIVFFTISIHSTQAYLMNPADILKDE